MYLVFRYRNPRTGIVTYKISKRRAYTFINENQPNFFNALSDFGWDNDTINELPAPGDQWDL